MVLRFFLLFGVVLMGVTAYFIVIQQPPTVQLPPAMAEITKFQKEGLLPTGDFEENEEIEHDIFEVPPMDEMMLEQAMKNMGNMSGMNMEGGGSMNMAEGTGTTMKMDNDSGSMAMGDSSGTAMKMEGDGAMNMAEGTETAMQMDSGSGSMAMGESSGTAMKMEGDGAMNMAEGTETGMKMDSDSGSMAMAEMAGACEGDGGLAFCPDGTKADREINLSMREWEFDQMEIDVQAGERIRFTVRNDGTTLHEFMFMTMPLMQAVNYRAKRADWSLLEHEALFEKSLLLPGQELSFVVEVQQAGSWMFMCMLPYHMQLGMMGQMATPGAAMEM